MNPSNTISFKLHAIVYKMDAIANQIIKADSDMNLAQFLLVLCVYENPGVNQRFIANWLQLTEATVSYTMGIVVKKGLLCIQQDNSDSRVNYISITSKGKSIIETIYPTLENALINDFSVLSSAEFSRFNKTLDKLIGSIEKECIYEDR
jgi:DNA-binding MarR family transcriptional regulator